MHNDMILTCKLSLLGVLLDRLEDCGDEQMSK